MDITRLLARCVKIERGAGELYEALGARFDADDAFAAFWRAMAADERAHAHKLDTWRRLLARQPAARRPNAGAYEAGVERLELLLRELRQRARSARTPDDALSIALDLESSELDVIYVGLLQSSPIARHPDVEDTRRVELSGHHEALLREVDARARDERNRSLAAILAASGL